MSGRDGRRLVMACLVAVGTAAAQVPPDLETALSETTLLRIRLTCDIVFGVYGDEQELFRRWEIGPRATRSRHQSYVLDGERFRFKQSPVAGDAAPMGDVLRPELAFDGAEVQIRSGDSVCSVYRLGDLANRFKPWANLFPPYYFNAVRIGVPRSPRTIGSLPSSLVLQALYAGSKSERTTHAGRTQVRVVEKLEHDRERVIWVDPALGCAVTEWSVRQGGKLVETHRCQDFQRVGRLHLPKTVETEWYSWSTVTEIAERPLMKRTIRVTEMTGAPDPTDFHGETLKPGAVLVDSRLGGGDREGFVAYRVPVGAAELTRAFRETAPELWQSADGRRGVRWTVAHGLGLLLWAGVVWAWRQARCPGSAGVAA